MFNGVSAAVVHAKFSLFIWHIRLKPLAQISNTLQKTKPEGVCGGGSSDPCRRDARGDLGGGLWAGVMEP